MGDGIIKKIQKAVAETLDDEEFPNDPNAARIMAQEGLDRHDEHSVEAQEKAHRGE